MRYLVDDVAASVDFYTRHFGFTVGISSPAFADVTRGNLRLLLSGPQSSAGRAMTDGERPGPGGWNRIHLIVDDLDREIARLTDEGVRFRNEVVTGPGGAQVLAVDPSGNLVELFQPAGGADDDHARDRPHRPDRARPRRAGRPPDERVRHGRRSAAPSTSPLIADPASGLKIELGRSDDAEVHFRHLGFRADDVDGAHEQPGRRRAWSPSEAPHRRDFAGMYTSFLKQPGGVEVQLVKYDDASR